jgi:hypothetical protein
MAHIKDGVLRRLVDEPLVVVDARKQHLNSCPTCQARFSDMRQDAQDSALLLSLPPLNVHLAPALAAVQEKVAVRGAIGPSFSSRLRRVVTRPLAVVAAVAAVAGSLAFTPVGSVAQSLVTVFQPSQVVVIPINPGDLRTLPDLNKYGTVHIQKTIPLHRVIGARQAGVVSSMNVLLPGYIPSGVPAKATYEVAAGSTASFTFSALRAQAAASSQGASLPAMPANIDGTTLLLTTHPVVVAIYGESHQGLPSLVIGQMRTPSITSNGASVSELENYILSLPGISPDLAAEVRAIRNPVSTLPIPIPVNLANSQSVTVQGTNGVAIGDSTGIGSVVFWTKNGVMHGVGGTLPESQVLQIANSLH